MEIQDIRNSLESLKTKISSNEFPADNTEADGTKEELSKLFKIAKSQTSIVTELWEDIHQVLSALVLSPNAAKLTKVTAEFRHFYSDIDSELLQGKRSIMETWGKMFTEIVDKGSTESIKEFAGNAVSKFAECEPSKSDSDLWLSILKAMMKHPDKNVLRAVLDTIDDKKFKKIWNWKKNAAHGQALINMVEEYLPRDKYDDGTVDNYGRIVESILEQFTVVKMVHKVAYEGMDLCLKMFARRNKTANWISKQIIFDIKSMAKVEDSIPDLLKRYEKLLKDKTYPFWDDMTTVDAGYHFIWRIVKSYEVSIDVADEVNELLISIFRYCLEEDVEYVELENGYDTIFMALLKLPFKDFIRLHTTSAKTQHVLKPFIKPLLQILSANEDEALMKIAASFMYKIKAEHLAENVSEVADWYIATQDENAISVLATMYKELDKKYLVCDFDALFGACAEDSDNMSSHSMLFTEAAKKTPEVFKREIFLHMLEVHYNDPYYKSGVLTAMTDVVAEHPESIPFEEAIDRVLVNYDIDEMYSYYTSAFIAALGTIDTPHVDQLFDEALKLSKECKDPMNVVFYVNAMKTMAEYHGPKNLKKHRAHFEHLKKNAVSAPTREAAEGIIDSLENRSLEGAHKEAKKIKKDVAVIDKKVKKNTKDVKTAKKQVEKNTKGVEKAKKGVETAKKRVEDVKENLEETNIKVEEVDSKTISNAPSWAPDVTTLMNTEAEHDWRLLASRLGYSSDDIKGWATMPDPCLSMLDDWYSAHKTSEATHAVYTALEEMNREDALLIVENAMKCVDDVVEEEDSSSTLPTIFLSYQWGHQNEVKLLRNHLQMAGYKCWMDIGQMGGGDKLFEKIDDGIRGAKVIICCTSEKYAKSPNCNREVNLSVNLGKTMIPLLMEKMEWPPRGSMGPIFTESLFIRFFQRPGEETADQRYWPVPKFQELLMQINLEQPPDDSLSSTEYKDWWKPMVENIVPNTTEGESPDIFLSYQWGKQPQIQQLYRRLTELGLSCWMDIYQMGGGDSLYDKIDRGVRGCKIVLNCVTHKYSLSANCRREVSLADSTKKPMIPLLLEKMDWPPAGPMSMVFTQLPFIDFTVDENIQTTWTGTSFDSLLQKIHDNGVGNAATMGIKTSNETEIAETEETNTEVLPVASVTPEPIDLESKSEPVTEPVKEQTENEFNKDASSEPARDVEEETQKPQQQAKQTENQPGENFQTTRQPTPTKNRARSPPNQKKSSSCVVL